MDNVAIHEGCGSYNFNIMYGIQKYYYSSNLLLFISIMDR